MHECDRGEWTERPSNLDLEDGGSKHSADCFHKDLVSDQLSVGTQVRPLGSEDHILGKAGQDREEDKELCIWWEMWRDSLEADPETPS